jgi:uridine kinase
MTKLWIGLTGSSGSGKDVVAGKVLHSEGLRTFFINCDMFYKPIPAGVDKSTWNYDIPSAIDFPLLIQAIHDLKQGKKTYIPKWDFNDHYRMTEQDIEVDPGQYDAFLVGGILVLSHDDLIKEFDIKIYTHASPELCLARRKNRDVQERGRTADDVQRQWDETVYPAFVQHILPVKSLPGVIVVTNELSKNEINVAPALESIFNALPAKISRFYNSSDDNSNRLVAKLGKFGVPTTLQIDTANHQVYTPLTDDQKIPAMRTPF